MFHVLLIFLFCLGFRFGKPEVKFSKIVGKNPCAIDKHPYVVSIQMMRDNIPSHQCAGSILNSRWVLSAANCFSKIDKMHNLGDYLVVAGISEQSDVYAEKAQKSKIEDVVQKKYDAQTMDNDIALVKLKDPLKEGPTVQFVKLPDKTIFPKDISELYSKCEAVEWGTARQRSAKPKMVRPEKLMCVNMSMITLNKCLDSFQHLTPGFSATDNHICALYEKKDQDVCGGDSGGPLICEKLQHGIISREIQCELPGVPSTFTRVDKYIDWITLTIENNHTLINKPRMYLPIVKSAGNCLPNLLSVYLTCVNIFHIWFQLMYN